MPSRVRMLWLVAVSTVVLALFWMQYKDSPPEKGIVCDSMELVKTRGNANMPYIDTKSPPHTLILWAHYFDDEKADNLQFFLAQGIVPHSDYRFVVIVSGSISAMWHLRLSKVTAPNFRWYTRPNIGYDMCAWKEALDASFKYFVLLNKSVRGPFLPPYYTNPWPDVFTSRLNNQIKLSGTSINCNQMHIQSMLWAFDVSILDHVKTKLHCFHDKNDAISQVEQGLPMSLLQKGYRLASTAAMFAAHEGVDQFSPLCAWNKQITNGDDQYWPSMSAGFDLHPLEMVFFKTNRHVTPALVHHYSVLALMNNNFTVPISTICLLK